MSASGLVVQRESSSSEAHPPEGGPTSIWARLKAKVYRGFYPRYVWKDGLIGGVREYVGCGDEELTWINFFIDLCYVAYVSRMSHVLTSCVLSGETVALIVFMSDVSFNLRVSISDYSTRFFTDDYLHRILFFTYVGGIVIMIMTISTASGMLAAEEAGGHGDDSHSEQLYTCTVNYDGLGAYVAGYSIAKTSVALLQLVQRLNDSSGNFYRQYNLRMLTGLFANVLMVIGSRLEGRAASALTVLLLASELEQVVNAVVIYVNRFMNIPFFKSLTTYHYPVNIFLMQENTGIFVMVFVGEGVIKFSEVSFLSLDVEESLSYFSVLVLLFSFSTQYFDRVQRREHDVHAATRNVFWGFIWFYMHRWLALCILFITSGFTDVSMTGTRMLSAGCGMATFVMIFMRLLHKGFAYRFASTKRVQYLGVELLVAIAHWLLYIASDTDELSHAAIISLHAALALFYVTFDTASVFFSVDSGDLASAKEKESSDRPASQHTTMSRLSTTRYSLDDSRGEDAPDTRIE